jgi:hypothetical protein
MTDDNPDPAGTGDALDASRADTPEADDNAQNAEGERPRPREIGGRAGPDPTRYGDWEKNGRCIDF